MAVPFTEVNAPATMIFPSLCSVTDLPAPSRPVPTFAAKSASRVPSALRRAMRLTAVPFTSVKDPAATIFPSGCTATDLTLALNPVPRFVVNAVSRAPSLATWARMRIPVPQV